MAFLTAAAGLAAAGAAAYGTYSSSQAAGAASKANAAAIDANNVNAANQLRYQAALNAEAMKRAVAGTINGRGDTSQYDPATNTWIDKLSPQSTTLQRASDNATLMRNSTDQIQAHQVNDNNVLRSLAAQRAEQPALAALENYHPLNADQLTARLQGVTTNANRTAQQPIIADTLRQFARSGSAPAPVLTAMMRDNANTLRQGMVQNEIDGMQHVGGVNQANQGALIQKFDTLHNAGNPTLQTPGIAINSPSDALAAETSARASGASQPASYGAGASVGATNASTAAARLGSENRYADPTGATIASLGQQLPGLIKNGTSLYANLNNLDPNNLNKPAASTNAFDYNVGLDKSDTNNGDSWVAGNNW